MTGGLPTVRGRLVRCGVANRPPRPLWLVWPPARLVRPAFLLALPTLRQLTGAGPGQEEPVVRAGRRLTVQARIRARDAGTVISEEWLICRLLRMLPI